VVSSIFFYLLLFFIFLAYSQPSQIGCLPYFHTWTKAHIDNRKKFIKQQYLPPNVYIIQWTLAHRRLTWFLSLRHPSKFQSVSRLHLVTAATSFNGSQPNIAGYLAVSWAVTLYIHFWRLLPRNGILPGAKITLRPSLALSYIGSVTARHWSSWRQLNFAALSRGRHLYSAGRPSRWASAHILVCSRPSHFQGVSWRPLFPPSYFTKNCPAWGLLLRC